MIAPLHAAGTAIRAKAWTHHNGDRYLKQAFTIDLAARQVTYPVPAIVPIRPGAASVRLPGPLCDACVQRLAYTAAPAGHGRSLTLHPQKPHLRSLRAAMRAAEGRASLRQRFNVEHRFARLVRIPGGKARHEGARKHTLDYRRYAAVVSLEQVSKLKPVAW